MTTSEIQEHLQLLIDELEKQQLKPPARKLYTLLVQARRHTDNMLRNEQIEQMQGKAHFERKADITKAEIKIEAQKGDNIRKPRKKS